MAELLFLTLTRTGSCAGYNDFDEAYTILITIIWAVFSGVRMYAISGRSWCLASIVCLLNLAPVGVNAYLHFVALFYEIVDLPILGNTCYGVLVLASNAEKIALQVAVGTRVCVIAADVLILVVTWMATYRTYRDSVRNNIQAPLVGLLLKDGTLYFTMLLALNVLNIAGTLSTFFLYTASLFTTPLSSIIVTHFLLNLRQASTTATSNDNLGTVHSSCTQDGSQPRSWSSRLSFNHSFIDNMGEDVDYSFDTSHLGLDTAFPEDDVNKPVCNADGMDEETGHVASDAHLNEPDDTPAGDCADPPQGDDAAGDRMNGDGSIESSTFARLAFS
ncbi:hypothetical protein OBBRIDRAFT_309374 [Obba rivulosa]|uniref:Uncharacterized protein n=1 Tax=Obba rivulosa TaxID=1052685 RepID=A0A8E2DH54_9APHY|nr:hypothetical protein OBBRIDRAFT_309374 [Obba rivulosa]